MRAASGWVDDDADAAPADDAARRAAMPFPAAATGVSAPPSPAPPPDTSTTARSAANRGLYGRPLVHTQRCASTKPSPLRRSAALRLMSPSNDPRRPIPEPARSFPLWSRAFQRRQAAAAPRIELIHHWAPPTQQNQARKSRDRRLGPPPVSSAHSPSGASRTRRHPGDHDARARNLKWSGSSARTAATR